MQFSPQVKASSVGSCPLTCDKLTQYMQCVDMSLLLVDIAT